MFATLVVVARLTLGLIFLASASTKFRSHETLVRAIQQYGMGRIGSTPASLLARLLPPFELLIALLCISGLWLPLAAGAALGALGVFTLAMALNLAQGRRFRCNCFGSASAEIGFGSLCRNLLLLLVSLFVVLRSEFAGIAALRADAKLLTDPTTIAIVLAGCSAFITLLAVGEIDSLFHRTGRKGA